MQMSAVAASKRLLQSMPFTKFGGFNVPTADRLFIDPSIVRSLEAQGMPTKQAEAITAAINDNLESVARSFVSKGELQKVEVIQESNSSKIKSELQISQDETEKFGFDYSGFGSWRW